MVNSASLPRKTAPALLHPPVCATLQGTGRLDFEQFVSALLDLGDFKGWDGERVLKAVRCLNIEGHMFMT